MQGSLKTVGAMPQVTGVALLAVHHGDSDSPCVRQSLVTLQAFVNVVNTLPDDARAGLEGIAIDRMTGILTSHSQRLMRNTSAIFPRPRSPNVLARDQMAFDPDIRLRISVKEAKDYKIGGKQGYFPQ